ncbi:MAG: hypothetical protein KY391_02515 [Actinobacteria bacterium]|nr:hypothetical protein [Actinomycetota bacterium]
MERSENAGDDALLERVRDQLDRAQASDDEVRLDTLETLRRDLEAELDSSLENDPSRH